MSKHFIHEPVKNVWQPFRENSKFLILLTQYFFSVFSQLVLFSIPSFYILLNMFLCRPFIIFEFLFPRFFLEFKLKWTKRKQIPKFPNNVEIGFFCKKLYEKKYSKLTIITQRRPGCLMFMNRIKNIFVSFFSGI